MRQIAKLNFIRQSFRAVFFSALLLSGVVAAEAAGVTLTAAPNAQTVGAGKAAAYTININRTAYTDKVALSASNLPAGVTATFSSNPAPANSSVLTLQTATSTPLGTFTITIKGSAQNIIIAPITVKLKTEPNKTVWLSFLSNSQTIAVGQTAVYDININRVNYNGSVTLSATSVPSGVTVSFSPQTTNGNFAQMRVSSTNSLAAEKTYQIGVTAASSPVDPAVSTSIKFIDLVVDCGVVWARQFNPSSRATAVYTDGAGNTYVAGYNYAVSYAAKFDASGNQRWIGFFSTNEQTSYYFPTDIVADGAGGVYVAGLMTTGSRIRDIFIRRLNDLNGSTSGIHERLTNSFYSDGEEAMKLSINGSGNVVLTAAIGVMGSQSPLTYNLEQFVFDSNFNFNRIILLNNAVGRPGDVTVDSFGSIYVTGIGLNSYEEVFLYKYTPGFVLNDWFVQDISPTGGNLSGEDFATLKIAVNQNSDVFVKGVTRENAYRWMPVEEWITKVSQYGIQQWRQSHKTIYDSGDTYDSSRNLTVDAAGDIYYGGGTTNPLSTKKIDPLDKFWFAKRSGGDGRLLFVKQLFFQSNNYLWSIAPDNAGNLLLAGQMTDSNQQINSFLTKFSLRNITSQRPEIYSVSPTMVSPGSQFVINGANFSGAHTVFYNGKSLPFAFNPANPTGEIFATAVGGLNNSGVITVECGCSTAGYTLGVP